jgi:hypothetical protein
MQMNAKRPDCQKWQSGRLRDEMSSTPQTFPALCDDRYSGLYVTAAFNASPNHGPDIRFYNLGPDR